KAVRGSKVVVLGVAFKRDVDDVRESPALDVMGLLEEKGAEVVYHDPYVPTLRVTEETLKSQPLDADLLENADCVVIVTDHKVIDWQFVVDHASLIVDSRHVVVNKPGRARVISL